MSAYCRGNGLPCELGRCPGWVQAAEAAGALWVTISGHQRDQATDFVRLVKEISKLSDDELEQLVRADPRLAELVNHSWHAASVSAEPSKRRLLAMVVSRALAGARDDAIVDEGPFIASAVEALEPAHLKLLALIARPSPQGWNRDEVWTADPTFGDLIDPALSALVREGLIFDRLQGAYGGPQRMVNGFGRRVITDLAEVGVEVPALDAGEVYLFPAAGKIGVQVYNTGLGTARSVELHGLEEWQPEVPEPFDLEFHATRVIPVRWVERAGIHRSIDVTVRWVDGRGPQERTHQIEEVM